MNNAGSGLGCANWLESAHKVGRFDSAIPLQFRHSPGKSGASRRNLPGLHLSSWDRNVRRRFLHRETMLQPLRDRILVEPDPTRDDITAAGIIVKAREGIHTSDEQLGKRGTVVALGAEVDRDQLKAGDRILFGEFNYPEYFEGARRYLVLQDKDVCAVLE